eukprot:Pompholyxophrys_punicea_v1_NODE_3_length_10569_cov_612.508655.p3 type:complete len:170 gc:universal NODE_3_length_10569_cov_612.508655:3186-2677(-)
MHAWAAAISTLRFGMRGWYQTSSRSAIFFFPIPTAPKSPRRRMKYTLGRSRSSPVSASLAVPLLPKSTCGEPPQTMTTNHARTSPPKISSNVAFGASLSASQSTKLVGWCLFRAPDIPSAPLTSPSTNALYRILRTTSVCLLTPFPPATPVGPASPTASSHSPVLRPLT